MTKREFLGAIWTDVAAILVGDPCRLLSDDRYEALIEQWETQRGDRIHKVESLGGAISVVTGADGWCPVWVDRDAEGRPFQLTIGLSPRVDPTDDRPVAETDFEETL